MGTHTPYGDLSQRGLLDTIKTAHNKSRLDGRLRLTASAFNLLWISMPEVLVTYCYAELTASFIKFSITACYLLDFMVQGKITEPDATTVGMKAAPSGLLVLPPPSPPCFYAKRPFCHNTHNLSWLGTGTE